MARKTGASLPDFVSLEGIAVTIARNVWGDGTPAYSPAPNAQRFLGSCAGMYKSVSEVWPCPFVARRVPGNQIRRTRPRRSRGSFAARELMAAWGGFSWRACCVWRERREFRAAPCSGACVVSASSFSSARTAVIQEGKTLAVKMPRHPQKTGGLLPDTAAK